MLSALDRSSSLRPDSTRTGSKTHLGSRSGTAAFAPTPVIFEATLVGALSAQLRRPPSRSAMSGSRRLLPLPSVLGRAGIRATAASTVAARSVRSRPHCRDSNGVVVRLKSSKRVKAGALGFDPSRARHPRADHPPFRHSRQFVAHHREAVVAGKRWHDATVMLAEPAAPMGAPDIANVGDRRAAKLRRTRHSPARHDKLALAVRSVANDRSHLVREDP